MAQPDMTEKTSPLLPGELLELGPDPPDGGGLAAAGGPPGVGWLGRSPDGVPRCRIAMAGGLCEHRRLHLELEERLLFAWRWQGELGALGGELPGQAVPDWGMRDVAGHPGQVGGVLLTPFL